MNIPMAFTAKSSFSQAKRPQTAYPHIQFSGTATREYTITLTPLGAQLPRRKQKDLFEKSNDLPVRTAVFTKAYLATCLNKPDFQDVGVTIPSVEKSDDPLQGRFTIRVNVPGVGNQTITEALSRERLDRSFNGSNATFQVRVKPTQNEVLANISDVIEETRTKRPVEPFHIFNAQQAGKADKVAREQVLPKDEKKRAEKNEKLLLALQDVRDASLFTAGKPFTMAGMTDYTFRIKNTPYKIVYSDLDIPSVTIWYDCLTDGSITHNDEIHRLNGDVREQVLYSTHDPGTNLDFTRRLGNFFKEVAAQTAR